MQSAEIPEHCVAALMLQLPGIRRAQRDVPEAERHQQQSCRKRQGKHQGNEVTNEAGDTEAVEAAMAAHEANH